MSENRSRYRQADHLLSERNIAAAQQQEKSFLGAWDFTDSPLLGPSKKEPFGKTFQDVIPEGMDLREYIELTLAPRKGKGIGIEFGGPGSELFKGFSNGFFERSAGINLTDPRNPIKKFTDKRRNHTVIPGDMQSPQVQEAVEQWLGGNRADLIIERMKRGLEILPKDVAHLSSHFANWYSMLGENGLMFAQVPRVMTPLMEDWVTKVHDQSDKTIEVVVKPDRESPWMNMALQKHEGAPETIPLLSSHEVLTVLYEKGGKRKRVEDYLY